MFVRRPRFYLRIFYGALWVVLLLLLLLLEGLESAVSFLSRARGGGPVYYIGLHRPQTRFDAFTVLKTHLAATTSHA